MAEQEEELDEQAGIIQQLEQVVKAGFRSIAVLFVVLTYTFPNWFRNHLRVMEFWLPYWGAWSVLNLQMTWIDLGILFWPDELVIILLILSSSHDQLHLFSGFVILMIGFKGENSFTVISCLIPLFSACSCLCSCTGKAEVGNYSRKNATTAFKRAWRERSRTWKCQRLFAEEGQLTVLWWHW